MPIKSNVTVESLRGTNNHKLEIVAGDRPGLLSTIAHAFLTHEVQIQTAKINTLGKRAEDVFLISGKNGVKLSVTAIEALEKDLIVSFN
jgi:[protein-PII] uridylyltransferase